MTMIIESFIIYSEVVTTYIGRIVRPQPKIFIIIIMESPKCVFDEIIEEDHIVDLCALEPELVDKVAILLWEAISKTKNMKQPYSKLKKWLQNNGRSNWQPGNKKEILCQWVAAMCIFVEDSVCVCMTGRIRIHMKSWTLK